MSPLRTKKKRSPGRPKENKLIRELKVKTWFAAVAKASGKTAYELEKEFAPSYVDREEFGKRRARLWDKYRLGKTMPTMTKTESGRRPVALLVEEAYPGTLQWLESPIWMLLDLDIDLNMNDLRSIYESLDPMVAELIIEDKKGQLFWRKYDSDPDQLVAKLHHAGTMDGLIAIVCLWRESILCQQFPLHNAIQKHFKTSIAGFPQVIVKALQKLF
jgi:hypothetical protein